MKLVVTGADGMLGRALMARLTSHHCVPLTEPSFSLEDRACVLESIVPERPDWVVHTAAMTHVDGCEADPARAYAVNALGTAFVAEACRACGAGLLYVSTDFVFGHRPSRVPIEAWEEGQPLSVYGMSKWGGERYVQALAPRFIIARTAWLYGHGGTHFVGTILRLARQGAPLKVVDDQVGNPSYATDVADGMARLLECGVPGWYHVVNEGHTSWFEFAKAILAEAGMDPEHVKPCSTQELGRPAPRPPYSALSTLTYRKVTGHALRPWREALRAFLSSEGLPG